MSLHHIIRVRFRCIEALAGAAPLALCVAAPAPAVVETNPASLDRSPGATWVLVTGDPDEAWQPGAPPKPAAARLVPGLPAPTVESLPPSGNVVEAVFVPRMSCPERQIGSTPGYETEAHVCALLARLVLLGCWLVAHPGLAVLALPAAFAVSAAIIGVAFARGAIR